MTADVLLLKAQHVPGSFAGWKSWQERLGTVAGSWDACWNGPELVLTACWASVVRLHVLRKECLLVTHHPFQSNGACEELLLSLFEPWLSSRTVEESFGEQRVNLCAFSHGCRDVGWGCRAELQHFERSR